MNEYLIVKMQKEKLDPFRALIFSKWLRSLRYGNDHFRAVDSDAYYKTYHDHIEYLIDGPATVRLAVLADDYDVVLGFSVTRPGILDYVFVQKEQRHQGIAQSLVPDDIVAYTHRTKLAVPIIEKHLKHLKFNPFV